MQLSSSKASQPWGIWQGTGIVLESETSPENFHEASHLLS